MDKLDILEKLIEVENILRAYPPADEADTVSEILATMVDELREELQRPEGATVTLRVFLHTVDKAVPYKAKCTVYYFKDKMDAFKRFFDRGEVVLEEFEVDSEAEVRVLFPPPRRTYYWRFVPVDDRSWDDEVVLNPVIRDGRVITASFISKIR